MLFVAKIRTGGSFAQLPKYLIAHTFSFSKLRGGDVMVGYGRYTFHWPVLLLTVWATSGCQSSETDRHIPEDPHVAVKDTIRFSPGDDIELGPLLQVRQVPEGFLVRSQHAPLHLFGNDGLHRRTVGEFGIGPGAYSTNYVFSVGPDGHIYVFDNNAAQLHKYDGASRHVSSIRLDLPLVRTFAVDEGGDILVLNETFLFNDTLGAAVLRFNAGGEKIGSYGRLPASYKLQSYLEGGGLLFDEQNDRLFYSFLSDHRVYAVNLRGTEIDIIDDEPDYYVPSDLDEIESVFSLPFTEQPRAIMQYALTVSWVVSLDRTGDGFLIQGILPYMGSGRESGCRVRLEVWDEALTKVASGICLPNRLLSADENYLYVLLNIADATERYGLLRIERPF